MEATTTSKPCWKTWLDPLFNLEQNPRPNDPLRVAVVGIGNEFNGDDAAGVMVARRLAKRECAADAGRVLVIEAGQAPENITASLRRFAPQVVLLIDAAQVNAPAGEIAWIPWETTSGMSASSHSLPLSMLARYLTLEFGCSVHLLGIQPGTNQPGAPLSPPVKAAVEQVSAALCNSLFIHQRP